MSGRSDLEITDDVVACLMLVAPAWVGYHERKLLPLWVRSQLDEAGGIGPGGRSSVIGVHGGRLRLREPGDDLVGHRRLSL